MKTLIQDIQVLLTINLLVIKLFMSALSQHFCGISWFKLVAKEVQRHFQSTNEILLSTVPNPQMLRKAAIAY